MQMESQQNSFENVKQQLKESVEAPRSQIVLKICYLLEVWKFLDYMMHRDAERTIQSIIESLQLMLIVYCLASGMSEGGRAHLRVIKTTRLVF